MNNAAHQLAFTPRAFALRSHGDGDHQTTVAWGMTLPDGSAVTVDWRNGPSSVAAICGSPQRAAQLHDAELIWADKTPPGTPGGCGRPP